jgi:uncharacterized protein (TIRG00374 family)
MGIAILALALMNIGPLRIVMHKGELATEHRLGSLMAKNKWGKKALEFVSTFRLAVHAPGGMAVALGFALGVRIIEAVRIYVLFKAFGIGVPAYALILIESAWFFISPFMATPGGIGAVESGKTALYAMVLGLSVPSVAPVVFVDRFITFWLMILVGTVVMLAYRKRESDDDGMHISFPFPTFSTGSTPSQVPARDEG